MPFCSACTSCLDGTAEVMYDTRQFQDSTAFNIGLKHHRSLRSFRKAVEDGCPLCQELLASIQRKKPEHKLFIDAHAALSEDHEIQVTVIYQNMETFLLSYSCWAHSDHLDQQCAWTHSDANFSIVPSGEMGWEGVTRSPSTVSCRGVSEAHSLASYWLDRCLQHKRCAVEPANAAYCPSRLIEISKSSNGLLHFRLLSAISPDHAARYATLSYCWGDVLALDLTHATLRSFADGFAASVLPLTYQHAFEVCVALSIKHIWIDSLCIIQDDSADWLSESQQMSDIYRHALINISADASTDRAGGLFIAQTAPGMPRIQARLSQATYGLFKDSEYDFVGGQGVLGRIDDQPLSKRGWVYQERILSPRILHFTTRGLVWECSTHLATEVFKQGIEVAKHSRHGERKIFDAAFWHHNGRGEERDSIILSRSWMDLVVTYSCTRLTFPDDRPVAIQGIARAVTRLTGMEFITGLSKEHLLQQLLWHDDRKDENQVHASRRRMPSFTWLSVNGPILFEYVEGDTALSEISDVQIGELEHTPQGLKQEGVVEIKAVLRSIRLLENVWEKQNPVTDSVEPMIVEGFEVEEWAAWRLFADGRPGFLGLQPSPTTYYVIFLYGFEEREIQYSCWQGLILEPIDLETKVFRRIGYCELIGTVDSSIDPKSESGETVTQVWLEKTSSEEVVIKLV